MTTIQLVDMALAYQGINRSKLAEKLGWSYNQLKHRLQTGKLTLEEWDQISKAIGADRAEMCITFPDGKVIK